MGLPAVVAPLDRAELRLDVCVQRGEGPPLAVLPEHDLGSVVRGLRPRPRASRRAARAGAYRGPNVDVAAGELLVGAVELELTPERACAAPPGDPERVFVDELDPGRVKLGAIGPSPSTWTVPVSAPRSDEKPSTKATLPPGEIRGDWSCHFGAWTRSTTRASRSIRPTHASYQALSEGSSLQTAATLPPAQPSSKTLTLSGVTSRVSPVAASTSQSRRQNCAGRKTFGSCGSAPASSIFFADCAPARSAPRSAARTSSRAPSGDQSMSSTEPGMSPSSLVVDPKGQAPLVACGRRRRQAASRQARSAGASRARRLELAVDVADPEPSLDRLALLPVRGLDDEGDPRAVGGERNLVGPQQLHHELGRDRRCPGGRGHRAMLTPSG